MRHSIHILGCRLDVVGVQEATREILRLTRSQRPSHVVTLGTEMVVRAQRDTAFREIINTSDLSVCDTVGLLAVARLRGACIGARVTGLELVENLCAESNAEVSMFLFGGAEGVAKRAQTVLEGRYPRVRIVGARSGFFGAAESPQICAEIAASGAKILLVGLGSPRQERWLQEHLAATGCAVGIGVGGSFDVLCGNLKRAPLSWRRLGLEWLHRLLTEPWRWRRQIAIPHFILLVLSESFAARIRQRRNA